MLYTTLGPDDIIAEHNDGEKRLTVREVEQRLADLEQARYRIAALEAAMLEAGVDFGNPWEDPVDGRR
ncbi:MAG: hypothetical protein V3W19_09990 [Desulfatiglandales bacterium]